jgi:hypothetical protein
LNGEPIGSSSSAGTSLIISSSAPASQSVGTLWFNTQNNTANGGDLFVQMQEPIGNSWVPVTDNITAYSISSSYTDSSSIALSSSVSISSSFASFAHSASFAVSSSRTVSSSFAAFAHSASFASASNSASFASTASFVNTLRQDVVVTGSLTVSDKLISTYSVGDEGGEILLAKPQTNNSLTGSGVTVDIWQNRLRFFEQGGNARGAYLDISTLANGVGTNLLGSAATASYVEFSNVALNDTAAVMAATNVIVNSAGLKTSNLNVTVASGGTAFRFARITNNNNTAGYLGWSAEL